MPTRPPTLDQKLHGTRRRHGRSSPADALYGLLYPPNHLRLVNVSGDPADRMAGLMTFDRNLGSLPGDVGLWCAERKGFAPALANPRVVRVLFNTPLESDLGWSFDPSGGSFRGADGCAEALAASGTLGTVSGPVPAGKLWVISVIRSEAAAVDFRFSTSVSITGDVSGFWATDEFGNPQSGNSVMMIGSDTIRVYFNSSFPAALSPAGIVAGFTGIYEYADFLSPVTWRV